MTNLDDLHERIERAKKNPLGDQEKVSAGPSTEDAAERNSLFLTARELAAQTPEETQWVAVPWVAKDAITELSGKIKAAGKTTFTLAMCRAIVTGAPFLGRTPTKGPVVFLTEQPLASFRQALERANLLDCDDFHILQWHKTNGMSWPDVVVAARLYANEVGAVLMVVDTLAQFAGLRGDAENNAGAALEAIAPLQMALADGLGILLTRHDRKGGGEVGDSARGSSAFAGAVDIVLQIQRGEGNTRPTIRVINALSRFHETPDQLMVELTDDGYIALGDKSAVAADEARTAIIKIAPISEADAATEKDILEAAETKRTIGQDALRKLTDERVLIRIGEGKRGNPFRYWKPEEKVSAATSSYSAAERNEHSSENTGKVSAATTGHPAERNWYTPSPNGHVQDDVTEWVVF